MHCYENQNELFFGLVEIYGSNEQNTVKLGYNDHGYNEITAITNKIYGYFWSLMATY